MSPEVALLQRMQAVVPNGRFYMLKLPQSPTLPAGVVQLIDDIRPKHLRGGDVSGVARVQISYYRAEASGVDPYDSAETLLEQVHGDDAGSGLSGYRGQVGGSPEGVFLTGVFPAGRRALYEPGELRVVGIQEDYMVHYRHL